MQKQHYCDKPFLSIACLLCRARLKRGILVPQRLGVRLVQFATLPLIALAMAGCSNFVTLEDGAEQIEVITLEAAADCEKLAETSISLITKVAGVKRDPEKSRVEAESLARNSAMEFNSNAVAPLNALAVDGKQGKQKFGIYRCEW